MVVCVGDGAGTTVSVGEGLALRVGEAHGLVELSEYCFEVLSESSYA